MLARLNLGDIPVDVHFKNIKNVHLSVHPPAGDVRISAPTRMKIETLRVFAISKLPWIKRQQKKFRNQERESPRDYIDRESHYVWGKRYLLKNETNAAVSQVLLQHKTIIIQTHGKSPKHKRQELLEAWYRELLKKASLPLIEKWEHQLGVKSKKLFIQKMKTKWGSCNPTTRNIRLNTDLAKKPKELLEYVIAHELVHLLEPTHNARFIQLMDHHLPKWKFHRQELNFLPIPAEK